MSSDKEKDKDKAAPEAAPETQWYDVTPSMSELYRRKNQSGNIYPDSGAASLYPDYKQKYDIQKGRDVVSGPLTREFGPRMKNIEEKLRSTGVADSAFGYQSSLEDMKRNIPTDEDVFDRLPPASEKPSETFGQYIMRPPAYEEKERVFNTPGAMSGGGFMPYHGTSVATPDTVSTFADGIKIFINRMKNDARYFRGKMLRNYFDEDEYAQNVGKIMVRGDKIGKSLYDMTSDDMIGIMYDLRNEKKRVERGDVTPKELNGETVDQHLASLDGQIKVIQNLIKAKRTFATKEKYDNYIRSIYQNGGQGLKTMSEANTIREQTPETKGWATAGDISSGIISGIAPVTLGVANPWLGAAALAASLSSGVNSSMAEASMEMDAYEKATGKKISNLNRNAYVWGVGSVDLLLESLMQGYFFKNIPVYKVSDFKKHLQSSILSSKNALDEMKELVERVVSQSKKRAANAGRQMLKSSMLQAGTDATQSIVRDVLTTIYRDPEHYPTLTNVISNAAVNAGIGLFTGAAMDVISRRSDMLFGPRRQGKVGYITYVEDLQGKTYQYLGVDSKTGLFRVMDMEGNIKLLDYNDIVDPRTITYDDYLATLRGQNEPTTYYPRKYLKDNNLSDDLNINHNDRDGKMSVMGKDENLPEKKTTSLKRTGSGAVEQSQSEVPDRNIVNTNRVYRFDEDLDKIIDRGVQKKIYYDEPTASYVDLELPAPEMEDLKSPLFPKDDYRPGRQGSQKETYDDAPFLNGDELTWRMFNPEEGAVWLKNNPFFDPTQINHTYANETPIKSPYRPYYYLDKNISNDEYLKRLFNEMIGKDDLSDAKKSNFDKKDYGRSLMKFDPNAEYNYATFEGLGNTLSLNDYMVDGEYMHPLYVNGEMKMPSYRHERGRVQPIPYVISPYEDMLLQAKEMANRLQLKTRLYKTYLDVPEKLRDRLGIDSSIVSFYNPANKEIGIIMENSNIRDVQIALLKYGIVERGLKNVLGENTSQYLKNVYKKIPKKYKKYYYEEYPSIEEGAAAYMVDVATDPKLDDTGWDELSAISRRELMIKYGIGEIKDVDLRYILWQAVNRIREDDSIEEMQRKNNRLRNKRNKENRSSSESKEK